MPRSGGGRCQVQAEKAFPVSWDQFHRDARALAWRLAGAGPFNAVVCITRGGLVPAAIVSRELEIRLIETVCVASYHDYKTQGERGAEGDRAGRREDGRRGRTGMLIVDDLVDTGRTAAIVREMLPKAHFATVYAKPHGPAAGRHLRHRGVAGHLDLFSLGHGLFVPAADREGRGRVGSAEPPAPRVAGACPPPGSERRSNRWVLRIRSRPFTAETMATATARRRINPVILVSTVLVLCVLCVVRLFDQPCRGTSQRDVSAELPLANDPVSQPDENGFEAGTADETIRGCGLVRPRRRGENTYPRSQNLTYTLPRRSSHEGSWCTGSFTGRAGGPRQVSFSELA